MADLGATAGLRRPLPVARMLTLQTCGGGLCLGQVKIMSLRFGGDEDERREM